MMRTSVKNSVLMIAAAGAVCLAGVSQAGSTAPSEKELTGAVKAFLADHGDLCVAKYSWPRDVTPADEQAGSNDAKQLPVLERLGVVRSVEVSAPAQMAQAGTIKRYSLTAKGKQYYLQKKHVVLGLHDQPAEHDADFCVAHLTLDKVVKWSPPELVHEHLETVVRYSYHIRSADWMADPQAREVFPVVDRIIHGEGSLLMSATVQLHGDKWVPVLPGQ
jgi:hypothetical protein